MTATTIRFASALGVAVSLAFSQTAYSQGYSQRATSAGTGSATQSANAEAVMPFTIHVPDDVLTDLRRRLANARFADEFPDAGWDYGTNLAYLKSLVAYWRDKYDWRTEERRLNQFAQFTINIDGLKVHFIHQRSKSPNALPLLLLNGWPSSMEEYYKVISPLTDPVAYGGRVEDSFHVIIPSMPGFGFSDKPRERGYNPERMAGMWVKLMARLGYTRYGTHGSDWGAGIATRIAVNDASHVVGLHLAGCGGAPPSAAQNAAAGSTSTAVRTNRSVDADHNFGYQELQSTKPQTVGQGLSDSPVALASWIVEKWYGWSDHDGDLEKIFTKDELLTNIMVYWVTNSGASSARIYYENRHINGELAQARFPPFAGRVTVPTGCGAFPSQYDRRSAPLNTSSAEARAAAAARYNLVHFTTMPRGGHFPAFEQPKLWVDDIRAFYRDRR